MRRFFYERISIRDIKSELNDTTKGRNVKLKAEIYYTKKENNT
ncbi:hypothetical protein NT04LM_0735 [Listeria monocytogenes FSL F2-208]|nr:hypothetical protein NT04LM_0735 [Listeria monocytogenes FSL F2-208]